MLQALIRGLSYLAQEVFIGRTNFIGSEPVREGPALVVANHHNGFADPVVTFRALERKDCRTAAKSELWRYGPIGFVLYKLIIATVFRIKTPYAKWSKWNLFKYLLAFEARIITYPFWDSASLIPVFRRRDGEAASKNMSSLNAFGDAFERGEAVVLFAAEDHSRFRVAEFQRGAAKAALDAELEADWAIGIVVQPLGITWSRLGRKLGACPAAGTVNRGEPILLKTLYEQCAASIEKEHGKKQGDRGFDRLVQKEIMGYLRNEVVKLCANSEEQEVWTSYETLAPAFANHAGCAFDGGKKLFRGLEDKFEQGGDAWQRTQTQIDEYRNAFHISIRHGDELQDPLTGVLAYILCPLTVLGGLLHWIPVASARLLAWSVSKGVNDYFIGTYTMFFGSVFVLSWWALMCVLLSCFWSLLWGPVVTVACVCLGLLYWKYRWPARFWLLSWTPGYADRVHKAREISHQLYQELGAAA